VSTVKKAPGRDATARGATQEHNGLRIGDWLFEPDLRRLHRRHETRRLTNKAAEVLKLLAEEPRQLQTREEILEQVWPHTVGEEVLTRAISDLRGALGDEARKPAYIETIPKAGYRLIACVDRAGRDGVDRIDESDVVGESVENAVGSTPLRRSFRFTPKLLVLVVTGLIAGILSARAWISPAEPSPAPPRSRQLPRPVTPDAFVFAVPLIQLPGLESDSELSPDGDRLAFTRRETPASERQLFVASVVDGSAQILVDLPGSQTGPTWSPDGKNLAFMNFHQGACTVKEVPSRGGPYRELGDCGDNRTGDLAWSPDGEWLAFSDRVSEDAAFGIVQLSTLTGEKKILPAAGSQHWGDHGPAFSPDGRWISFIRSVSMGTADLFRAAVGGGPVQRLTHDARSIDGHAWTPDGRAVIVSSRRTESRGLWRIPVDGGSPEWLPLPNLHARQPTVARRGGQLLFETRNLTSQLETHSESASQSLPINPCQDSEVFDPQFSEDGKQIVFVSDCSGRADLWLASADGTEARQLTSMGGAHVSNPSWCSEDSAVVFDARLDGQADIYRIELASGTLHRMTQSPANDLLPSVSADGSRILFASNRTEAWQIWSVDHTGDDLRQVTDEGAYAAQEASDGSLYATQFGREGLFRRSVGATTLELVSGSEGLLGSEFWTVKGRDVFYLSTHSRDQDAFELMRYSPEHGNTAILRMPAGPLLPGFAIAPGEERFILAPMTRVESDLWIVESVSEERADMVPMTRNESAFRGR